MLYIVGLGPGDADYITPRALNVLKECKRVMLRTGRIKCAEYLAGQVGYETLDDIYESSDDFDALCAGISKRVLTAAAQDEIAYAVSDVSEATVGAVMQSAKAMGMGKSAPRIEIVPGVPACGAATAGLSGEFQIADAADWESVHINPRLPLIICLLYTSPSPRDS